MNKVKKRVIMDIATVVDMIISIPKGDLNMRMKKNRMMDSYKLMLNLCFYGSVDKGNQYFCILYRK